MDQDLLIARSVTQAQQMLQVLRQIGVRGTLSRTPAGLTDRGCSYAIRIRSGDTGAALKRLKETGREPVAVFTESEGGYREVVR